MIESSLYTIIFEYVFFLIPIIVPKMNSFFIRT